MLIILLTTVHVLVCVILIVVVLLQHGKSADIAATFGGAGSQTAFGPRGTATVLSRVTTVCAVIFMLTSISLTLLATRNHPTSIMQNEQTAPAKK
jgi:preprotein translocase subunit SecG